FSALCSSRMRRCACFFQAEDGIRVATVTGVQTCALPILLVLAVQGEAGVAALEPAVDVLVAEVPAAVALAQAAAQGAHVADLRRSEERRVGKECRAGGSRAPAKKSGSAVADCRPGDGVSI